MAAGRVRRGWERRPPFPLGEGSWRHIPPPQGLHTVRHLDIYGRAVCQVCRCMHKTSQGVIFAMKHRGPEPGPGAQACAGRGVHGAATTMAACAGSGGAGLWGKSCGCGCGGRESNKRQ